MKDINELKVKYTRLFSRILNGYVYFYNSGDKYYFVDSYGNDLTMIIDGNSLVVKKDNSTELIELPDEEDKYIRSIEIITDERDNGKIVNEIQRFYSKPDENSDYYVSDLYQITKCFNIEDKCIKDDFECHTRKDGDVVRYNNKDISFIYRGIEGPLRLEKILDLYNGNMTPLVDIDLDYIDSGLLDSRCFNYRQTNGMKKKMNDFLNKNISNKRI